jgi:hypothetical protein
MNHSSLTSILGQGRWWHVSLLSRSLYALLSKHHFITSKWMQTIMFNTWESIQTNSIFSNVQFQCKHTYSYQWLWKGSSGRRNSLSTVAACEASWLWLAGSHRTNQRGVLDRATGYLLARTEIDCFIDVAVVVTEPRNPSPRNRQAGAKSVETSNS